MIFGDLGKIVFVEHNFKNICSNLSYSHETDIVVEFLNELAMGFMNIGHGIHPMS